uniref:Cysteine-rich and transmembrane domain-containing protein PCC1 n=1 Tax=Noccaea caerulescens TaxID=107243 RepID=A0A1J3ESZ2_NOCCA
MNHSDHNQVSAAVDKPSQGPYTSPPPIGYPTRGSVVGDPPVAAVETKSKGDGFWKGCCAAICCCCVLDACF